MTQTKRFLVYVASNHQGLQNERYEVERQLVRMGILCCGFPCRDDISPYDWNLSRSQIEDADLFLMIVGDEYEPMAPTGISFLHRELVHAQSLSKPVLSFVKNSLPTSAQTEDQRRLAGFHKVISKESYRLWHLREELISHVKSGVVNALTNKSGGWMKLPTSSEVEKSEIKKTALPSKDKKTKNINKHWQKQVREPVLIKFSSKVYEAGNNTLQETAISQQWGVLFKCAGGIMKRPSSDDRLRQGIESLVQSEVTQRILSQHPAAHAVDDIRINRGQFQRLLDQWLEYNLVSKTQQGGRSAWLLTSEGVELLTVLTSGR